MHRSAKERLQGFWDVFDKDDDVLVCINADPDALACALAIKRLLRYRVKSVVVAHPNEIRRLNNVAMVERLKIPLERLNNIKTKEYSKKFWLIHNRLIYLFLKRSNLMSLSITIL